MVCYWGYGHGKRSGHEYKKCTGMIGVTQKWEESIGTFHTIKGVSIAWGLPVLNGQRCDNEH